MTGVAAFSAPPHSTQPSPPRSRRAAQLERRPSPPPGARGLGDFEVGVGALYGSAVGEEEAGDLLLSCAGDGRDLGVLHGEESVRVREARRQGGDYEVVAVEGDDRFQ